MGSGEAERWHATASVINFHQQCNIIASTIAGVTLRGRGGEREGGKEGEGGMERV